MKISDTEKNLKAVLPDLKNKVQAHQHGMKALQLIDELTPKDVHHPQRRAFVVIRTNIERDLAGYEKALSEAELVLKHIPKIKDTDTLKTVSPEVAGILNRQVKVLFGKHTPTISELLAQTYARYIQYRKPEQKAA